MDDSLISFLVFAAIIFVSAVFGKKKEKPIDGTLTESSDGSVIAETMKELIEKPKHQTFQKHRQNIIKNNYTDRQEDKEQPLTKSQEDNTEKSDYGFNSTDDIKKAIIWSEILNRKY